MAKIGYARISTNEQNIDLQLDALKQAGCDKIFHDITSGAKSKRLGLDEVLNYIRPGDTLIVWKLDRLGRSLKHLMKLMTRFQKEEIYFCSLQEQIDTSSSTGKLIFHVIGAIAEFERDIIRQRTEAGLKASRARGRIGGRPKIMTEQKIKIAEILVKEKGLSIPEVAKNIKVSRATLYRYLAMSQVETVC